MPCVSVIISIYKPNSLFLKRQLESIDNQDFDDMEIVIYNDCPEDSTWEKFCTKYCKRHPLRFLQGNKNLGYIKAFEHLITLAKGKYLAFCDQDDRWLPGRIKEGAKKLDEGYLLTLCDRQIIDADDVIINQSWRHTHPLDHSVNWSDGEHFASKAAFNCYSIGMATMMRADIARQLIPFPICTGHDKWLALGANTLGPCANIDKALVQYRQHSKNVTGAMKGIYSKQDWKKRRVESSYSLAQEYSKRFPKSLDAPIISEFANARMMGRPFTLLRYWSLAPRIVAFETLMNLVPQSLFPFFLKLAKMADRK
ncbi:glycosyltransferase [uncultured Olegusella sp.]|uniref:glycosyltransferase n=1 Tax=uncultured Olegusella sp. TaxID=1979846 RepID=UPI002621A3C4|nr:glycosyltransferase [uncultured Olegusella sp.]